MAYIKNNKKEKRIHRIKILKRKENHMLLKYMKI